MNQSPKPRKGYKQVEGLFGKYEEIPEEWEYVNFGKIAKQEKHSIKRGPFGSSLKKEFFVPTGYKVYEQKNAIYDDFTRGTYYINSKKFNELKDFEVKSGDFIISCSGTVGRISLAPKDIERGIINQALLKISIDLNVINATFFKFLFRTPTIQNLFTGLTHGSAIKNIVSVKELKQIPIKLPTLQEQEKIANMLSNIDELITTTQKIIEQTKSLKQGLMQKLLTKGISHKRFKKIKWLFGKEIEIPEEWEWEQLSDNSTLKGRIGWQGLTTKEYQQQGEFYLVTGTDFKKGKIDWENCVYVDEERYSQDSNIQLKKEDVLITKDGTIGKIAYVDSVPLPSTLNTGVFVVRPKNKKYISSFFYYVLHSDYFLKFLNKLKAGSTINHLYQRDFNTFHFPIPSIPEQQKIASILSNIDSQITSQIHYKEKLERLKKSLMQKLLTGEVRVKV